jgi:hypothetical protein
VVILLIIIGDYSININFFIGGYSIGVYWWLLVAILLMTIGGYNIIGGYYINGYWWLLY